MASNKREKYTGNLGDKIGAPASVLGGTPTDVSNKPTTTTGSLKVCDPIDPSAKGNNNSSSVKSVSTDAEVTGKPFKPEINTKPKRYEFR